MRRAYYLLGVVGVVLLLMTSAQPSNGSQTGRLGGRTGLRGDIRDTYEAQPNFQKEAAQKDAFRR